MFKIEQIGLSYIKKCGRTYFLANDFHKNFQIQSVTFMKKDFKNFKQINKRVLDIRWYCSIAPFSSVLNAFFTTITFEDKVEIMKGKTIYKLSIASSTLSSFKTGGARGNVDLIMNTLIQYLHTKNVDSWVLYWSKMQEVEIMPPRVLGNRVRDKGCGDPAAAFADLPCLALTV